MTGDRFHTLFKSGRTLDLSYRRNALRALQKKVSENRKGVRCGNAHSFRTLSYRGLDAEAA